MHTGIVLAAAMTLAFFAAWAGSRAAAAALVLLAAVWLNVDRAFEGPHLLRFTPDHGVVVADLFAVAAVVGAFLAWRRR